MMAALDLLTGPRERLVRTRTVLGAGGESHLVLGGGTAPIARWHRRETHDLDFFLEREPFAHLLTADDGLLRDFELAATGLQRSHVRPGFALTVGTDGGEISTATSRVFAGNPRSAAAVRRTFVALEAGESEFPGGDGAAVPLRRAARQERVIGVLEPGVQARRPTFPTVPAAPPGRLSTSSAPGAALTLPSR